MYDVIVLGATFVAAGIAERYKEKCLVLERRLQAGYEFFGTLYGGGEVTVYRNFEKCHTIFDVGIVSIKREDGAFLCVTHGVDGFCTYKAKRIIDTRCNADMCVSKTYNLLIESEEEPDFSNLYCEKVEGHNRYILHCEVPLYCGYVEARTIVKKILEGFSETQRLILSANEFDYRVKADYPKTENGILYLPSRLYADSVLAFEAGLDIDGEVLK